ncbi:MAG: cell division protein FtsH [Candidatus Harrisonbacteria bacterium CG10_big_fil_rev_8_21_14_0_10_38_8]|uniref:ATP-dependent zinc metalloprotease FtsH n=1 Tax=Candidatus Harrisonbacteria bacterium CG10_big_fil_rev_8_21_14_0_10_38_8 TaxID=1974582 RepID=A0A2M6WJE3_9BACT|nr:MAG: cell division protein FtsH [Candidatus Harrisonbacteria bacterium CG10_big_fil_rev_8_21_14_0_10_38_8]
MKNFAKNISLALISLIFITLIFSSLSSSKQEIQNFSINEVVQRINSGDIQKIGINGNNLSLTLADGKKAQAKKEFESGLSETLRNFGVDPVAFQSVTVEIEEESGYKYWAGILIPTLLPIIVFVIIFWLIFRGAKGGQNQVMSFGKANIKMSAPGNKGKVTFKDVAGLKEVKQELVEIVDFLKNPKKFLDIGAKIPRGVLLMGAPGSGKTLLARAIAGESGVPFFYMSASEFVEMFVGVGASRIRDAFNTAKKHAPAILFIDEIDAVGRQRGAGLGGGHDEREQTLNQILVEMDGFDRENRVIVLAATNRPDILDSALLRPGRFDRRIVIDLPDIEEREEILKIHAKNKPIAKDVDYRKVAVRTPGFSGADLENLINEAAIMTARENKKIIDHNQILDSIEKVLLGPAKSSRVTSDREKNVTAYHEAGHALLASVLEDADPVHKVSIIGRGRAGGYTMKLPIEENRLKTKKQFVAELATMLGGYASEEIIFKDVSTGASNDLKEATNLAKRLVTKYGMSDKLGPVTFDNNDAIFVGKEISAEKDHSEATAAKIDQEVSRFLHDAYKNAKRIILEQKKVLDGIAKELVKNETLEQDEFDSLVKKLKIKTITL